MPLTPGQGRKLLEAVYDVCCRNTDHIFPFDGAVVERFMDDSIKITLDPQDLDLEPEKEDTVIQVHGRKRES
jgi:hypothetical protein